MVREDIGKIVNYAKEKGIWVGINSNGSFVPAKINEIDKANLLVLSFDGPNRYRMYKEIQDHIVK